MLDVFDRLNLWHDITGWRVKRLEATALPFGIVIQAHWSGRCSLSTSQIERLTMPLGDLIVEDYQALTLKLAQPSQVGSYEDAIKGFCTRTLEHYRDNHRYLERAVAMFDRVHLVRPYLTTPICKKETVRHEATDASLTCRHCAALALRWETLDEELPFAVPKLRKDEILLATRVSTK